MRTEYVIKTIPVPAPTGENGQTFTVDMPRWAAILVFSPDPAGGDPFIMIGYDNETVVADDVQMREFVYVLADPASPFTLVEDYSVNAASTIYDVVGFAAVPVDGTVIPVLLLENEDAPDLPGLLAEEDD